MNAYDEERFDWLKRLMEWQKELDDPNEFLESVKVELFTEECTPSHLAGSSRSSPRVRHPLISRSAFTLRSAGCATAR